VTIQQQTASKNTRGELLNTWTDFATRRASVEPINGREYWQQSGEHSDITTRIRIRYDASLSKVKPKDRIIDRGHSPSVIYDVQSVIRPRETKPELILMCVRGG